MSQLDVTGLRPLDTSGLTPVDSAQAPLDNSGLKPLDVSGLTPMRAENVTTSLSDYPVELGKSFVEGAKNLPASSLKGIAASQSLGLGAQERAGLGAGIERVAAGEDPAAAVETVRAAPPPIPPLTQDPVWQAGEAIENLGKEALAPRPGFEGRSWTRDIGSGFGSVAGGIGMSLLSPAAAGLMFVTSGQGEAADRAVKAGATPEQIQQAARFGTIAGATDVVDALLPALGSTGKALGLIGRVGYAAVAGALAEGGQEGLQQFIQNAIARGIYKPDQDLLEDVPRNIAVGMIVGGGTSGTFSAAEGKGAQNAQAPTLDVSGLQPVNLDQAVPADAVLPAAAIEPEPIPAHGTLTRAVAKTAAAPLPAEDVGAQTPTVANLAAPLEGEVLPPIDPTSFQQVPWTAADGNPWGMSDEDYAVWRQQPENRAAVEDWNRANNIIEAEPLPPTSRFTLEKMLADPRSADEMRAEIEAADAWSKNFRVSPDWQEVRGSIGSANMVPDPVTGAAGMEFKHESGKTYVRIPPAAGTKQTPVQLEQPSDVALGAEQTADPTPAQAEAGNYRKRHLKWEGLDITIETEAGGVRRSKPGDPNPWEVTMPVAYGEVLGTKGKDGDALDVFIGPNPKASQVYIIDQIDTATDAFDEHKIMQGFDSEAAARAAYEGAFSDGKGPDRIGGIKAMPVAGFKSWAKDGETTKALSYREPVHAGVTRDQFSRLTKLIADRSQTLDPKVLGKTLGVTPGVVRQVLGRMVGSGHPGLRMTKGGIQRTPQLGPQSLFQFIASRGGIAEQGGELGYLGLGRVFVPGFGALVRRGGMSLDRAREAAAEAGYLRNGGADISELLEAFDREARGAKVFSIADEQAAADRQAQRQAEEQEARVSEAKDQVRAAGRELGAKLTDEEIAEAAQAVLVNGADPIDALTDVIERAAVKFEADQVQSATEKGLGDEWSQSALDTAAEDAPRAEPPPARERPAGNEGGRQERGPPPGAEPRGAEQPQEGDQLEPDASGAKAAERVEGPRRDEPPIVQQAETVKGIPLPAEDEQDRASKAIEAALDKIEEAVEAGDRKAVMDAAREAKKVLAATPQAIKDADPEYWSQFGKVIAKMIQPGYVTGKQQAEAEATRSGAPPPAPPEPKPAARDERPGQSGAQSSMAEAEAGPMSNLPALDLATSLVGLLMAGRRITQKDLQEAAERAYKAKLSEGKFNRKDMADALELAVNIMVRDDAELRVDRGDWKSANTRLSEMLNRLPTQRVRDEEQVAYQQFSTPPHYAAAAAYAANLREGDRMLEPSAGTGSLVAAASRPGLTFFVNELAQRRVPLLRRLVGDRGRVFTEDAEQLDNILPDDVKPTVVVMNPPFSQTAGRMGNQKVPMVAANHIEAALNRLEDGGRLVAIVNGGFTKGAPAYRVWWNRIAKANTVQANIGVSGKVYEKYGTTFGTRLLVIDKVAPPAGHKPVLTEAQTVEDLMRALEPIRDGRPNASAEQRADQSTGAGMAARGEAASTDRGSPSVPAATGGVGVGGRGRSDSRDISAGGATGADVRVEPGQRDGVADQQPERAGSRGTGKQSSARPADRAEGGNGGVPAARNNLEQAGSGQSGAAAVGERVGLERVDPGKQGASEINESLYQSYEPQRVRVKGAKPHPGPLVESASMASVSPPPVTYEPHVPKKVIADGLLSLAQLETTVYAGQAHSKMLPAADGETPKRRGYFIGDGTGVGKGREISGIILDNWMQGRRKAIWISEKQTLFSDAKRDWKGLGQDPNLVFNAGKVKTGEPVQGARGIAFMTYDTLKGGMSDQAAIARGSFVRKQKVKVNGQRGIVAKVEPGNSKRPANITIDLDNKTRITVPAPEVTALEQVQVKSRVDQLVEWFGKDFDGVIAFDEAHNMGNATGGKTERGQKDAAQKALAGMALQEALPNARVVYVSATGATEVENLAYGSRLGLWGRGTPFASRDKFIADVEEGGIAAMELIARDMKQLGLYTARNLSYDGVEYDRIEHKLDDNQREIYDTLAEAWQGVLGNITAALELTGGNKDARAKSAALSAFWGAHQRFFNQIITSMQMPSVIKAVEADLAAGRQAVLQLTNTNEASQERAAAKATTAEEIEDLDITPRDQIIQLVERSFPTQEYEQYSEIVDGKEKVRSRPVTDSNGEPVQNKQAVRMRDALVERLASVRVPQGPLDMVLDHFGADVVAEVTGRGRRFILKEDEKTGQRKRVEDSRPGSANLAETDAFQAGTKKILVFSEAGGTGRSYHADNTAPSKNARRAHYLVQGGWRADKAVQGFGRTHRTNQASAPMVRLVTTDLQGQKRFISSIARRLAQLGALTKGQRQAGDQGIFSARDNLESTEAVQALRQFYNDLLRDNIKGITVDEFEKQTGLSLRNKDEEGRVLGAKEDVPPITQFLNRLLSLKIEMQNRVFDAFSERLDRVIEARQQAGLLDVGLETVRADKIVKDMEKVVHTVEDTAAETKYVKFTLSNRFKALAFNDVADSKSRPVKFYVLSPNRKVYAVAEASSLTDEKGKIVDYYRLINPISPSRVTEREKVDNGKGWSRLARDEAQDHWKKEIDAAPEFLEEPLHLISGAVLPIWDRLKGSARVVRLQTDAGEQFIGRVIPQGYVSTTLRALGTEAEAPKVTPAELFKALMDGGRATLANGWTLYRARVADQNRIELKGPSSYSEGQQAKQDGAFTEMIQHRLRYFIPTEPAAGEKAIKAITQYRPATELLERGQSADDAAESAFALRDNPEDTRLRTPFNESFLGRRESTYTHLSRELKRIGLGKVALKFEDTIERWVNGELITADGMYLRNVITIALDTENKFKTLHHEALHAIRRQGLFTPAEWSILTRAAPVWRQKFEIGRRYDSWPEWVKTEEAVAHAYAAWQSGEMQVDGRIARLFKRITDFLQVLGNALRGNGFRAAEDIFRSIDRGDIGRRSQPRDSASGQWSQQGAVAYAVPSGDGDLFKSEIVQTPDGPREQLIIPGAERISEKERLKGNPKRGRKSQRGTGGLPLFEEPNMQGDMFAVREPSPVAATLTGDELGKASSLGHLRQLASRYARANLANREVVNKATGKTIRIGWQGLKRASVGKGEDLLRIFPAIPDLLETGRYLGEQPDDRGRNDIKAIHKFGGAVEVGRRTIDVILTVREMRDGHLFYDLSKDRDARIAGAEKDTLRVRDPGLEHRGPGDSNIGELSPDDESQSKKGTAPEGLTKPDDSDEVFSLRRDPQTAIERQAVMQGFLARGQFLDRAIRMPFDWFGGTDYDGTWKPGARLFDAASRAITTAKFSVEGRFAFANPWLEVARAGLVDRYGLADDYVTRERERALDERAVMMQGAEVLRSLKDHAVGPQEAKVLQAILTGEEVSEGQMGALAEPIRAAVDHLGQEAVGLGLVSPESFERNRGTYLHRVYKKYEAEQNGLVRMVNAIMGNRRKKIIGDQLRGRGIFHEVHVGQLMKNVPGWVEAERGAPQNGERFIRLDEMPDQGALELDENRATEKPIRTVYWPADQAIPDRYERFRNQGIWEVRGAKGGKITLWRDFTKEERTRMGEILDARYTIGKTFMLMAHDLSVGKFLKDIAENEDWATSQPPSGVTLDAAEWSAQGQRYVKRGNVEWVKVPTTEIPDSGGKKRWGALAGKYVREEIWRDLNEIDVMSRPNVWRTLLTQWKLNKTARSPVVHMNNVMSNFVLMDMIDVRMQDLADGIRSYLAGDENYEEAFRHGAFGADMMTQEVREQVLKPVLDEIMRENTFQQSNQLGTLGAVSRVTELLWSKLKALDKKMIDAYRVEDEVFRMATYMRRRALGDDAKAAADMAREQFIDYDIRAPWVNMARNSILPFISYTYRAAPLVAKAVATRPWKLAKYFTIAYVLNAMAYALTGGDEDKERKSLRENEQGRTWIGTERMTRMPFNDRHKNPVFLDIRRWIPAGDIFDLSQGDLPAWLNFGGPLMIGAELFLNRQAFTGNEIVNTKTDDWWDRGKKRADHLYKSWVPSAAYVPNSFYWDRVANAVKGATDSAGRPYSVSLALASSVGIKLKPQDVEDAMKWKAIELKRVDRALNEEVQRLGRRQQRGLISETEFNKAISEIVAKKRKIQEKAEALSK
jgi:hypothetical protein